MMRIILVVDDSNSARDIQNRLQRASYDVTTMTATADEVITRADELRPDVILMDVRLKGETDGIEVAQQIKSRHDIPIIFITANADEATVRRAIAAEPDGFLIMPLDALELRAAIEIAIHRHGTEAKAGESDRHISELTESLSEVIFETDMTGTITFVNQVGLKEFGYTKEQVEGGMTLYDFVPPDKQEEIRESIAQAVIDEPSEWMEVPGLRRDGSTFPVSVRASLIVREGVPVGIRGIALNVTEQKRAEQKLEESERQLRELTDALPEIVFETDVGGTFTFLNPMGLNSLGYTEADLKKQLTIEDLIIPADLARARENFRKRLDGAAAVSAEYTVQRKDRSTFPLSIRTTAVIRDGVVVGARGIAVDITERKRTEAALIKSERHIREITDTLPVVVYEADETSHVTFVNATAFNLFGYTKEELEAGMSILQLVIDADEERARTMFSLRMGEDDVGRVEYTGRRKDGSTFPISVRGAPIRLDGAVVGVRGIIVDITERKQAEEKVKEYTHTIQILNHIVTEGNRATEVQSFAEAATKLACELMHFDIGGIYLIDTDARYATLRYAQGLPKTARDAIKKIPYHDVPYNAILIDGNPLFAEDYVSFLPQHAPLGAASLASVPLYSQDTIVGALNVGSATRYTFSQAEKDLLIAIGNEVGTVIAKLQADEALKESEKRIREITDALPVVVYETDATGRLTFVNATAFDLYGYTKEELEAGMAIFQLIATADQERAYAVFRRRMSGEDVGQIEYAGLQKDGSTFPVAIRAVLMRRDGAVVGMRGIIVDIAERKRAEERVKEHTHTIEILNHIVTEGNRAAGVQSFAETVTNLTLELLHFDVGTIYLGDDDARRAKLRYATGIPDTAAEAIREPPLDETPYAAFLVEPRPLFLDGHEVSRVPHAAELGLKSLAVVPLYRYDKIIGAFNVGSFKRHTFSQAEKELLIAIGNEVGVVIAKLQADEFIRAALKERETLLKEIHHRVKNNMQVVSSLLSLQAAQATEPETIEILDESQRQIRSMALIHEKLYRSGSLAEIDFGDYVKSLVDDLLQMYNVPGGAITIAVDIENVQLGVDTAIPCGLIINELVSNSLKYAFPDGRTGDVTVALQCANGVHTLTVADDGVGFPADLDFRTTDSLGMQLVTALVNQLEGTITLDRTKGTTFIITFKPVVARVEKSGEK